MIVAEYVLGHKDGLPLAVETGSVNPVKAAPDDG